MIVPIIAMVMGSLLWLAGGKKKHFDLPRYRFGTPEQIELFEAAANYAGLPTDWARHPALRYILHAESGDGWVGIPNFEWATWIKSQGLNSSDHKSWPAVWQVIRTGQARPSVTGISSHAAGLGQLQPSNMVKFQPDGLLGIGDAFNEAVGMLRYIQDRHHTMDQAKEFWEAHNWY